MVDSIRTPRAKASAVTTAGIGLIHLGQVPGHAQVAGYVAVLLAAVAVAALVAAARLWTGGYMDGRILALGLAGSLIVAQLLAARHGLPGAVDLQGQVTGWGVAAIALELLTIALLLVDGARKATFSDRRHPYAL